ncbi:unnamed protein product [Symbiodinium sp. CCMP2456]|nr:unnamed protein product [Symbiodinium sp. CCMP2456]
MTAKGLKIPLPGAMTDEDDPDLEERPTGEKLMDSPMKRPRGGVTTSEITVTHDVMRQLLSEQSQVLLDAQRNQLKVALQDLEARQNQRMDALDQQVSSQGGKMEDLERQLRDLGDRVYRVENNHAGGHSAGPNRRQTLVFGGWQNQTRKGVLLHQLDAALRGLGLDKDLDQAPFTTGLRRSVALCNFRRRDGETDDRCRERMLKVLQTVSAAKVELEGGHKALWSSFSKSPEERGRAALAALVKKCILRLQPARADDLEVEFSTGMSWVRDDQLSGMGEAPREVRHPAEVMTKAGKGWLDENTLARWCETNVEDLFFSECNSAVRDGKPQNLAVSSSGDAELLLRPSANSGGGSEFRILGWNIGGAELIALSTALLDVRGSSLGKDDLVLLQEVPRESEGWSYSEVGGRRVVAHRASDQWRGTGLWYDQSTWCVVRKLRSGKGTWFKLRHLGRDLELWVGTAHFSPGASVDKYEREVQAHFEVLPATSHRVVFQGDVNTPFLWARTEGDVVGTAKEGKGNLLHKALVERGLLLAPHSQSQLDTPTSRPRQEGRQGQCIDIAATKHLRMTAHRVYEDSFMCIGTDHELIEVTITTTAKKTYPRHDTKPRQWCGGIERVDVLDQDTVADLSERCTRPVRGQGYKDSEEIKAAFKKAKLAGQAVLWKRALKMRREARKEWEHQRLVRASEGDWHSFKALKPKRQEGWDITFAEAQTKDPHQVVHDHLSQVYSGPEQHPVDSPWQGDIILFTREELRAGVAQLKKGKAVGVDKSSTELVLGLMELPGGEEHLLAWYNDILSSQHIPPQWNQPVLVMLPKIRAPQTAKDLRPIAMGSTVCKLFCRLLLNRALPHIRPQTCTQTSGPGRQTGDYIFTIIRILELTREWGNPLVVFKLDLSKAFDCLDRGALLCQLENRLGPGAEMNCWRGLLASTTGLLQTPWGASSVKMHTGIKQGAIESPCFFAHIAEVILAESIEKYGWRFVPSLFPQLLPEEMMYMDDGLMWSGEMRVMQNRVDQLSVELAKFGLRLNPAKCQLYVSHRVTGKQSLSLNGVEVKASENLEVMGIQMRVGIPIYELVAPMASRARSKFWECKHIFRARGHMKSRVRVMERVVGATALWAVACVPPDRAAMSLLNSVQLQLMIWLLRLAKRVDESWAEFRQRAFRGARAALHSSGVERWSTTWLRRYWGFAGHRARGSLHQHPPISTELENYRTRPWWLHEQSKKDGATHVQRYPRLNNLDAVAGTPWRNLAYDRQGWKNREEAWVKHMDLPWSSGRQFSITEG